MVLRNAAVLLSLFAANPALAIVSEKPSHRWSHQNALEFSARPCFYFYAKFLSVGHNWMGNEDLCCATDEELAYSVSKIKEGYDLYQKFKHLQLEFVDSHKELAPGVFSTGYENGEFVVVNYGEEAYSSGDMTIPPKGYVIHR